jgi:putative endonuclease
MNKYNVYILSSRVSKKSYVGITNDIDRRLREHNSGKHFYTKRHVPWVVIHLEEYASLKEARAREVFLKTTSGRRLLKKIFARAG